VLSLSFFLPWIKGLRTIIRRRLCIVYWTAAWWNNSLFTVLSFKGISTKWRILHGF
jgi:hypothetical protein